MSYLHAESKKVKVIEAEGSMVIVKGGMRWNWELLFNGYRVSVWEDEKVLEVCGGDHFTTMWMDLMPLNRTLKNDEF